MEFEYRHPILFACKLVQPLELVIVHDVVRLLRRKTRPDGNNPRLTVFGRLAPEAYDDRLAAREPLLDHAFRQRVGHFLCFEPGRVREILSGSEGRFVSVQPEFRRPTT